MDKWFRSPGHSTLRDTLFSSAARNRGLLNFPYLERIWADHIAGVADHGTRLWLLLWLEVWFQMFVDKTRAVTDPLLETASCSLIR